MDYWMIATAVLGLSGIIMGVSFVIGHVWCEIREVQWEKKNSKAKCEETGCPYPRARQSLWCRHCKKWRTPKRRRMTPLGVEKLPRYLNG